MTATRIRPRRRRHPDLLPMPYCADCNKVAAASKAIAKEMLRGIEQRTGHTNEVRYYICAAGWWHWTRRDTWGGAR